MYLQRRWHDKFFTAFFSHVKPASVTVKIILPLHVRHKSIFRLTAKISVMKKMFVSVVLVMSLITVKAQKAEIFNDDGIAIHGYDAVAYFTKGQPVKGDSRFVFKYNDAAWYFASQEDLDLFKAAPVKYAPQYGGYCAYGLSQGHKAPTKADAFTIVNGKLYLNYNMDVKATWQKNTNDYISKGDANWPAIKNKE
jgi:YHS domain-containing protein